jgi:hypothetical protein
MINSTVSLFSHISLGSIMMDDENTKARNEIMRRIKMYQMKERNMPNFVRKRREELLSKVSTIVLTLIAITCK